jgi:23S rRNA pseudouridine2604 synthase
MTTIKLIRKPLRRDPQRTSVRRSPLQHHVQDPQRGPSRFDERGSDRGEGSFESGQRRPFEPRDNRDRENSRSDFRSPNAGGERAVRRNPDAWQETPERFERGADEPRKPWQQRDERGFEPAARREGGNYGSGGRYQDENRRPPYAGTERSGRFEERRPTGGGHGFGGGPRDERAGGWGSGGGDRRDRFDDRRGAGGGFNASSERPSWNKPAAHDRDRFERPARPPHGRNEDGQLSGDGWRDAPPRENRFEERRPPWNDRGHDRGRDHPSAPWQERRGEPAPRFGRDERGGGGGRLEQDRGFEGRDRRFEPQRSGEGWGHRGENHRAHDNRGYEPRGRDDSRGAPWQPRGDRFNPGAADRPRFGDDRPQRFDAGENRPWLDRNNTRSGSSPPARDFHTKPAYRAKATSQERFEMETGHDEYPKAPGSSRLSKRMSALGLASRREADEWITKGWVKVDGVVMNVLGSRVTPDQRITIDPQARHQQAQLVTVLLHKPLGYVSGQPEDGHETARALITEANLFKGDQSGIPFLPHHLNNLAAAGRLDLDSEGLLVLTQDGRIARQLIGEHTIVEKEYLLRVSTPDGEPISEDTIDRLRFGLEMDGESLMPAQVERAEGEQLRFVLRQGRKRQIRRMCEAVGLNVLSLKRIRIGTVLLGDLPAGQWRYMRGEEVFSILSAGELPQAEEYVHADEPNATENQPGDHSMIEPSDNVNAVKTDTTAAEHTSELTPPEIQEETLSESKTTAELDTESAAEKPLHSADQDTAKPEENH